MQIGGGRRVTGGLGGQPRDLIGGAGGRAVRLHGCGPLQRGPRRTADEEPRRRDGVVRPGVTGMDAGVEREQRFGRGGHVPGDDAQLVGRQVEVRRCHGCSGCKP